MVTINVAYTQAINPAGVTPVLTREQLWAGMERKVRAAHEFVPVFEACTVLEEHENTIVRETKLKPMEGRPGKTQKETCKLYKPTKVDFHEPTGATITNMVSDGPGLTVEELQMTYFFEWPHPDVEAGSDKEKELTEQHRKRGKMSVDKSIEAIRRMVAAGKL